MVNENHPPVLGMVWKGILRVGTPEFVAYTILSNFSTIRAGIREREDSTILGQRCAFPFDKRRKTPMR